MKKVDLDEHARKFIVGYPRWKSEKELLAAITDAIKSERRRWVRAVMRLGKDVGSDHRLPTGEYVAGYVMALDDLLARMKERK